ncbi:phage killer protein [Williamsia sp. D3]|nr:phage killer protein [Williamsia sp. D3]
MSVPVVFLDRFAVLAAGSAACGFTPIVGDEGLLAAAIARPQATAFGLDAYPTLWDKAAALMHSLANNHALLDGNKRTAWASAWLFLAINDVVDLTAPAAMDVDAAEQFVLSVSSGQMPWQKVSEGLRTLAP